MRVQNWGHGSISRYRRRNTCVNSQGPARIKVARSSARWYLAYLRRLIARQHDNTVAFLFRVIDAQSLVDSRFGVGAGSARRGLLYGTYVPVVPYLLRTRMPSSRAIITFRGKSPCGRYSQVDLGLWTKIVRVTIIALKLLQRYVAALIRKKKKKGCQASTSRNPRAVSAPSRSSGVGARRHG